MRRQTTVFVLCSSLVLLAVPVGAQPILNVSGAALLELIEIGKVSGAIGHKNDAILQLGDAIDDEVQIQAGVADPITLWVNQNLQVGTFRPSGIVDLDRQSRARWSLNAAQPVPQAVWTPIEFDYDPTQADTDHFDEHLESVPGAPGVPWTFVATEAGYYQVNARTAFGNFRVESPPDIQAAAPALVLGPAGGVSIAIFKTDPTGMFAIHSQGNNLQLYTAVPLPTPGMELLEIFLDSNNAPNVSDVVFLLPGEMIQIHAWWDGGYSGNAFADLGTGRWRTYVSVHKIS